MPIEKLLVANRGEIAIRIMRAARELGIGSVAVHSPDDAASLHVRRADESQALPGAGARGYLDIEGVVEAAKASGCDAVHPGYGFLAENAAFARRCAEEGITFVGPSVEALELFGDKAQARELAQAHDVPVLPGSPSAVSVAEAESFFGRLGDGAAMVIKAIAGGGGRGMRVVQEAGEIAEAYARAQSEAGAAFGNDAVFVERLIARARHIEIQVIGDGQGGVAHLGERECSVQRRHQKVVEIAPSPTLSDGARRQISEAAVRMAASVGYRSLGTFEFLVDAEGGERFFFIEANPRLQVEHTVTEEVTGVDLVRAQLRIAGGESLAEVGLEQASVPAPRGYAIQCRVNMERMQPDGEVRPSGGMLTTFEPPSGPGVRVDSYGYPGYTTNPNFDSLLAKVIAYSASNEFGDAVGRARVALSEFGVGGVQTNLPFLQQVLAHDDFSNGGVYTRWVDDNVAELVAAAEPAGAAVGAGAGGKGTSGLAGAQLDTKDPLAGLNYFREGSGTRSGQVGAVATVPGAQPAPEIVGPPNTTAVRSPLQGTILEITVAEGDPVREGQPMFVMDSMKMEHTIKSEVGGILRQLTVSVGDVVYEGHPMAFLEEADVGDAIVEEKVEIDLDYIPERLQEFFELQAVGLDENRKEWVDKRHAKGKMTQRECLVEFVDEGSWFEMGELVLPARHMIMSDEELRHRAPADGMITGIATVNADQFDEQRATTLFALYDETVWAGTQGMFGHLKTDRVIKIADEQATPLIIWAEGAGGRSGDTDMGHITAAGQAFTETYDMLAKLSGSVPTIGITAGRTFAGNASILGILDCVIATRDANIGMGGPATIEGGGLGLFTPEEIGPMSDLGPAGSVDILVEDDHEAIAAAKKYLSYFQGPIDDWECADQRRLRHVIPENRLHTFKVREVIELLADTGSVLELREEFGIGIVTSLIRIEGHPVGIIANNNEHLGGAVDSPGADKLCRFAQLCDAFNIPILVLCDTTGMMVGPDVERTGLARKCNNVFVTMANVQTPKFCLILRKAYGLAAQAMQTGSARAPTWTLAWPTTEIGGMNLEAAVRLGNRAELAAIEDIDARAARYEELVAEAYRRGKGVNSSSVLENDGIIDPAETRRIFVRSLMACENPDPIRRGRRPNIDTW
ncbi:MAG: Pyruvate carboxylase/Acetyl-CoA carboxylase [Chloroflexi bacterium]|nr:MAG: Pyruvate carboxylase/Acetyl-CoA carboxylase [Chloroflexota bacterium]